jgi:cold shock CspA family protein
MGDLYYNILWIDDEHETLSGTKFRAKRNGIQLIPFKSLNSGMEELEKNYPFYDGVLLDAKFFENEDDEKGSEGTYNVHRAKERLLQLKKKFKIFILTGQAEAYENTAFKDSFTNVYKKGSDVEIDRLFLDIKEAASSQEDTQIRHKYKRVFDVCSEKYIGEIAGQDLLGMLKDIDEDNLESYFNTLRKVVEDIFIAFNKFDLLPTEFITPSVFLNESSRFLSGKGTDGSPYTEKGYQHSEGTHLPKQIVNYLRSILSVVQPGSHRSEVDLFVKKIKTPFLLKSVLFQVLDLIVWFKMYIDSNPNIRNWVKVNETIPNNSTELIHGTVINLNSQKGFAFFKPDAISDNIYISSQLVNNHSLVNGMQLKVEVEEYIDNRTSEIKKRVKHIEL